MGAGEGSQDRDRLQHLRVRSPQAHGTSLCLDALPVSVIIHCGKYAETRRVTTITDLEFSPTCDGIAAQSPCAILEANLLRKTVC